MLRVLVCGGRDFNDKHTVFGVLDTVHINQGVAVIIDGRARGADDLASEWAVVRGIPNERYPADWNKHGKAAGMIRNREMLERGKPDLVVAFPGGRGTAGMIKIAREAGVKLLLDTSHSPTPTGSSS